MQKNWPLIESVLAHIHLHPEEHDQSVWLRAGEMSPNILNNAERFNPNTVPVHGPDLEDEDGDYVDEAFLIPSGMMVGSCGTAACFAGWATLLNGDRQVLISGTFALGLVLTEAGLMSVQDRASELLGIEGDDEQFLFNEEHTQEDLVDIINGWRENESLPPYGPEWFAEVERAAAAKNDATVPV